MGAFSYYVTTWARGKRKGSKICGTWKNTICMTITCKIRVTYEEAPYISWHWKISRFVFLIKNNLSDLLTENYANWRRASAICEIQQLYANSQVWPIRKFSANFILNKLIKEDKLLTTIWFCRKEGRDGVSWCKVNLN